MYTYVYTIINVIYTYLLFTATKLLLWLSRRYITADTAVFGSRTHKKNDNWLILFHYYTSDGSHCLNLEPNL